jgi:hypothetical protein
MMPEYAYKTIGKKLHKYEQIGAFLNPFVRIAALGDRF